MKPVGWVYRRCGRSAVRERTWEYSEHAAWALAGLIHSGGGPVQCEAGPLLVRLQRPSSSVAQFQRICIVRWLRVGVLV